MAKTLNFWKSQEERMNEYEKVMKEYEAFDGFRAFFIKSYINDYREYTTARTKLDKNDINYIEDNTIQMISMLKFMHENILDSMPLFELTKLGSGATLKTRVEDIITQDIMNIIRAENDMIDTYISAEPSLSEDDYWEQFNWSWNMVYEGCGFVFDNLDREYVNEFVLLEKYLYHKDELIANVKAKFGEEYFPTVRTFNIQKDFEVKAKTKEEAEQIVNMWLLRGMDILGTL